MNAKTRLAGVKPALQVEQVVRSVRRRICDIHRPLPEEFQPAHLSVALIDAVFNPTLRYCSVVVPIVERYCSHFGLIRTTIPGEWPPAPETQETLGGLISHYDELGAKYLRVEVFRSSHQLPRRKPRRSGQGGRRCSRLDTVPGGAYAA